MQDPPTELNLLFLGESGVGKSTFINSFANYMKHENFEAVQKNMLRVLIPARFNVFDKEFKKHTIEIGANDENADGAAATQDVKTYVFHITLENKSYLIRLIDTPGIGDPRGINQDNINCDRVLKYLGRLEKIHAICLLLKPTNTRLDVFLNYCVIQILSRLDKSATENIAFLFTNTRGQNYTPGETYISLELLVENIKKANNVTLPLSHENVFCFDNEAFRFLASIKQGVEFKEGILEANIESWKYSHKEVYRLISYIVQLNHHQSINHAQKMVTQLAQQLAEIVQLIGDNIGKFNTNQLLMENQTLEELKQKLYMPVIDILAKELPQLVTVCTAPQCSIYKVAEKNKFHQRDPPTEINVLLLGESGVGKSTFINSFANYMKHENFEAVQENMLRVLIPAKFEIYDKNFEKHTIEIDANDENALLADDAAATQDVKTYVFYITLENKSYLIRLIDTPGMEDPRGIDQDSKNGDRVLNYLGRLEKIHAICLLLNPTNTKLDGFLNYCVTQIFSRLDKSVAENIAFLFTNTRGQNYTPEEAYISLEVLVEQIKKANNITLPLRNENVFCFDNEDFRFLASIKQGVEFKKSFLKANIESWKYSYKEVYRLISYIVQLKPRNPKKIISINQVRKMVLQLAQPLAEIVQLIGDNIYQLDQHTNQLLMENQTLDELKQKLYMPVIDILAKELPQPVTVCTSPQCSTIYKVAEKNKFHYKQRCHNSCYLKDVPTEIIGDPLLLSCWAFNKSSQKCHKCGCRFSTHMHIYYETNTFENKIVDKNVQRNINTKEDARREIHVVINRMLNHKAQLEKELKYIIKCSAAFAHFLQQNAITPINDSLKEYVKYLITREERLGPDANRSTLDYLRRLMSEYEQEKNIVEEAFKHDTSGIVSSSPNIIEAKIRELFILPNFGTKIKELYDLHQRGGVIEHKQSEYVVKERYTLSLVDKFKCGLMGALDFGKSPGN